MGMWIEVWETWHNHVPAASLITGFIAFLFSTAVFVAAPLSGFAAHPLITDDSGTQGEGRFQLELNGEFSHDHDGKTTEDLFELKTIISFGIKGPLYLVVTIPYQHITTK